VASTNSWCITHSETGYLI